LAVERTFCGRLKWNNRPEFYFAGVLLVWEGVLSPVSKHSQSVSRERITVFLAPEDDAKAQAISFCNPKLRGFRGFWVKFLATAVRILGIFPSVIPISSVGWAEEQDSKACLLP